MVNEQDRWRDFNEETPPMDGTPVELFMPRYQCATLAYYRPMSINNEFEPGWVHDSGWRPESGMHKGNKSLYSHWRYPRNDAPPGYSYRKWNVEKQQFEYGKK